MRSSHRIGPVANWKFYPSPGSKIEICSLKAEHEPIPDICRLFYITAIRGQDILQLKAGKFATKLREIFYTVCNILHCFLFANWKILHLANFFLHN